MPRTVVRRNYAGNCVHNALHCLYFKTDVPQSFVGQYKQEVRKTMHYPCFSEVDYLVWIPEGRARGCFTCAPPTVFTAQGSLKLDQWWSSLMKTLQNMYRISVLLNSYSWLWSLKEDSRLPHISDWIVPTRDLSAMYKSLYAFRSSEPNSLHFGAGESFLILERSNKHWWLGSRCSSGETGYIPASYIEKVQVSLCFRIDMGLWVTMEWFQRINPVILGNGVMSNLPPCLRNVILTVQGEWARGRTANDCQTWRAEELLRCVVVFHFSSKSLHLCLCY